MDSPSAPKMTMPTRAVLRLLLDDPGRAWYGLQLCQATGLGSGTVSPMMARLVAAGWVRERWEKPVTEFGRPRRKYFQLTAAGRRAATAALRPYAGGPAGTRIGTAGNSQEV